MARFLGSNVVLGVTCGRTFRFCNGMVGQAKPQPEPGKDGKKSSSDFKENQKCKEDMATAATTTAAVPGLIQSLSLEVARPSVHRQVQVARRARGE